MRVRAEEIGAATGDAYKRGAAAERARWEKVVRGLVEALEGIRDEAYAMLDEEQPESSRYNGALMKLGYQAGAALATARELVGR